MMDRKTIGAIALCVMFYLAYSSYLNKKYGTQSGSGPALTTTTEGTTSVPGTGQEQGPAGAVAGSTGSGVPVTAAAPAANNVPQLRAEELTLKVGDGSYLFSQSDSGLASVTLNNYKATAAKDSGPVDLVSGKLIIQGTSDLANLVPATSFTGERQGDTLRFSRQQGPWIIRQEFSPSKDAKGLDLNVVFLNTTQQPVELTAGVLFQEAFAAQTKSGGFLPSGPPDIHSSLVSFGGTLKRNDASKVCGEAAPVATGSNESVAWFGSDSHYFLKAFLPTLERLSFKVEKSPQQSGTGCNVTTLAYQPFGQIAAGQSVTIPFHSYFGPKVIGAMDEVSTTLRDSINLGWFAVIAHPLLTTIKAVQKYVGNYGIAIIIVTILLKFLFYPLTRQAAVSMRRMQKLQPEMNRIKERNKDKPQDQQRELMKFMSANKINPAKGCLPILPQIPVFIALYNVLSQSIELRHTPFFGWIRDLSAQDPFYITPVLLGGCMFLQQKLTPNTGMDPQQQKIMQFMPLIFAFMMISLPAGLVIYMLTNTIVSMLQQKWLNRRLEALVPAPQMS